MRLLLLSLIVSLLQFRNPEVVKQFEKQTGYPKGRPGYVVDHKIPLCAGGPDSVENMQWQERQFSYLKDRFERDLCKAMREEGYVLVKR